MHECLYLYLLVSNLILFSQLNAFYIDKIPESTYVLLRTVDSSSTNRFYLIWIENTVTQQVDPYLL